MAHDVISNLKLERYRLGELSPREMAEVKAAIEIDPGLQIRLDALDASDREILQTHPAADMIEKINRRPGFERTPAMKPERKPLARIWKAVPLLAAAWLISILVIPTKGPSPEPQNPDSTLTKGLEQNHTTPRLALFHKRSGEIVSELEPDSRLSAGDLLQIAFSPGQASYGVILSVDGRGTVTLHHPPSEGDSNALPPSTKLVLLTSAYELDDAPGFERFYFVTASQPFSTGGLLQEIRRLAEKPEQIGAVLPLSDALNQTCLTVRK